MSKFNKSSNGRINITEPNIETLFSLYDKIPANQCTTYRSNTQGIWDNNALSISFFSKENMKIIQNGIRYGVYKKSNSQYIIGEQNCEILNTIMRSIFLQHSTNQEENITDQIELLNKLVLDYCIPQIYGEAQGYKKYLHDVSTLAIPMANPINSSQRDKNNVLMPKWF